MPFIPGCRSLGVSSCILYTVTFPNQNSRVLEFTVYISGNAGLVVLYV